MKINKFYLLRHGETDLNKLGFTNGQTDIPLNQNGLNQAKNIAEKITENFHDLRFDVILHSPLSRAENTADICKSKIKFTNFSNQ